MRKGLEPGFPRSPQGTEMETKAGGAFAALGRPRAPVLPEPLTLRCGAWLRLPASTAGPPASMPRARLGTSTCTPSPARPPLFSTWRCPGGVWRMGETLLEKSGPRCQAHSLGRGVGVAGRCRTCFPTEGFGSATSAPAWTWGVGVGGREQATKPGAASVCPVRKF